MNRSWGQGLLCVVAALGLALGCNKNLSFTGNAPADAGPSQPASSGKVDSGPTWASNADDVARFADEVPYGVADSIAKDGTKVHKAPAEGDDVVATLPKAHAVTKLAKHAKHDLIAFEDPRGNGQRLMGWVPEDSFAGPPAEPEEDGGEPNEDAGPPPPPGPGPGPGPGPSPGPEPSGHPRRHHPHRPHP